MKGLKVTYWTATGILSAIMLFSVFNYIFNNELISQAFLALGYPTHIVYPLALAKVLGVIAILFIKNKTIREWAYAGFFYNILLALMAHIVVRDGLYAFSIVAMIALIVSYTTRKKLAVKTIL